MAPACNLVNLGITALPTVSVWGSVRIIADMTFYLTKCKVTERHDARVSLRVALLHITTNVDYSYVYANRTYFQAVVVFVLLPLWHIKTYFKY